MKTRKLLILLALAAMVLAGPGQARSDCAQGGLIIYSYISSTSQPITAFFFLAESAPPNNWYYYCKTSDPDMIRYLATAQAGNAVMSIAGNAASCPSTGATRNMGVVKSANCRTH